MNLIFDRKNTTRDDPAEVLAALDKSLAIIEFALDGTILRANDNFLRLLGYPRAEVVGRSHRMFVDAAYCDSPEYAEFWTRLRSGEAKVAQFRRVAKDGREVWIEASYNPIRDDSGKPYKVVKVATDVTAQKLEYADIHGQIQAIRKSLAVIEFAMDGTVLTANENFLRTAGYALDEIKGKPHAIFVDSAYRDSPEYAEFWGILRRGEFHAGKFRRIPKSGAPFWIEATYNPILDLNGRPIKVVKYATDITSQVELLQILENNLGDISHSMRAATDQTRIVAEAIATTSTNVDTIASGTEELAASAAEIARSMNLSRTEAEKTFEQLREADAASQGLMQVAASMTGIVDLIQDIAAQINLLALNATIEAARAGDAGRGFTVVAGEVKKLAGRAAQGTEQIASEIGNAQSASQAVITCLDRIRGGVEQMRKYVVTTSSAGDEQSTVTRDISANMQQISVAVQQISAGIDEIGRASDHVQQALVRTREEAERVLPH
jgi:PAS domain S-box/PAS domain S-box